MGFKILIHVGLQQFVKDLKSLYKVNNKYVPTQIRLHSKPFPIGGKEKHENEIS